MGGCKWHEDSTQISLNSHEKAQTLRAWTNLELCVCVFLACSYTSSLYEFFFFPCIDQTVSYFPPGISCLVFLRQPCLLQYFCLPQLWTKLFKPVALVVHHNLEVNLGKCFMSSSHNGSSEYMVCYVFLFFLVLMYMYSALRENWPAPCHAMEYLIWRDISLFFFLNWEIHLKKCPGKSCLHC